MSQAVFSNDNGAVDDKAEIDCTQAHEISANSRLNHANGSHQHGQWDYKSSDQRGANIADELIVPGGYVTLAAWRLAPERFLALVLIDSQAGADTEEQRQGRYNWTVTLFPRRL